MGGDYPTNRWRACSNAEGIFLPVSDSAAATIKKTVHTTLSVDSCGSSPLTIHEQLLSAGSERQAQRYSAEAIDTTSRGLALMY